MAEHREPLILELDDEADRRDAPGPAEAPPIEDDTSPRAVETAGAAALETARSDDAASTLARVFWIALAGLVTLAVGVGFDLLLSALFARAMALGWLGVALAAALGVAVAGACLREVAGLARLGRIEGLRRDAEAGRAGDATAAGRALERLSTLMKGRADVAHGLARLEEARGDTPDPSERLALAERMVVTPLDAHASRVVEKAARNVAAATAIVPMTVLDVLIVLVSNLMMIRKVAEVYGGRGGWLGSWRLLKGVATHLAATGAIAATDDLVGPVLGHSVLSRLSRRFGEAALNAALTARVGVAAIDVCRPLPFAEGEAPRARQVLWRALGSWREKAKQESARNGNGRDGD
ncbi:MAG: YcjF family protein [Paracoccaceae bacterium]